MDGTEEKSSDERQEQSAEDCSKETLRIVKKLFDDFSRARLLEYVKLVENPKRLVLMHFLAGLAEGLGLTIGTAIVLTLLFKLTQHIIALNIPYITVWISEWIGQITELLHAAK